MPKFRFRQSHPTDIFLDPNFRGTAHFVGDDGCLGEHADYEEQGYYPVTWRDWTPGMKERSEWAWKRYYDLADPVMKKTPREFIRYYLGALIIKLFGYYWWHSTQFSKYRSQLSCLETLSREYLSDWESAREIKLVWSR